ncbi:MAG: SPASM domain-containing protein [Bacteroidales bacterium]|jgi:uncharacterized protein|nr:SPASM domain-containing protein [Bacteroidales bacterium]
MKWSKFNYLYFSKKHNLQLLYNSLSNVFINIDKYLTFKLLQEFRNRQDDSIFENHLNLYKELQQSKIIVESDEAEILKIKYQVLANRYSANTVALTVLPTLSCNFRCPYCFVSENGQEFMTTSSCQIVLKHISNLSNNNKKTLLNLTWMGGEPLLNFAIIKEMTTSIKKMAEIDLKAHLVTNGYLMDKEKILLFKDLNIVLTQVTIDGIGEQHNKTRIHKADSNSFDKIISNLDVFFKIYNKKNDPAINVRINLEKQSNYISKFLTTFDYLHKRYPHDNLYITPGFIEDIKGNGKNIECEFDRNEMVKFFLEVKKRGINIPIYPKNKIYECAVRSYGDFVIGPKGELYSCWEHIGYDDSIIGHLNEDGEPIITNELKFLRYLTDADYLDDKQCLECFFFPICVGGCPEKRIRNKHCNACFDVCVLQKENIEEILDFQYEIKK